MDGIAREGVPPPGVFVRAESKGVTDGVSVRADSKGLICTKIVQNRAVRVRAEFKGLSKGAVPTHVPAWGESSLGPTEGSGETSSGVNGLRCDDHGPF
jgi:hypothetical protein